LKLGSATCPKNKQGANNTTNRKNIIGRKTNQNDALEF
jgi:hypothetical protein